MKAILVRGFGSPDVLKLEDVPDPRPGPGEVLVRVRAVGINPVDTYVRSGAYAVKPELPYIPGSDAAGIVEAVGQDVTGPKPGDRVYTSGTAAGGLLGACAELAVCKTSQVHPLPESLSFSQGAGINIPYATAFCALFQRAGANPGETVLVHGASGGVGVAAIQLARVCGCNVIGTAGTERGRSLVLEQGAHQALDHGPDGIAADVILEMLANINLGKDLTLLTPKGRVVVIGSRGTVEINPRDLMARNASILGMALPNLSEKEKTELYLGLAKGLADGSLHPVVGLELPLKDAARGHEAVMEPGHFGKIVLLT